MRTRVQQDFSQIAQSLQSNNLAGAQQAYKDLVQLTPAGKSAIQKDISGLGTALQAGSLASAQSAFSKLQGDLAPGSGSGATTIGSVLGSLVKTALRLLG